MEAINTNYSQLNQKETKQVKETQNQMAHLDKE